MIVAHDIFGPNSGRLIEICDQMAIDLAKGNIRLTVCLPDFFRGRPFFDESIPSPPPPGEQNTCFNWATFLCKMCCLCKFCSILCSFFCDSERMRWDPAVSEDFEDIVLETIRNRSKRRETTPRVGILGFCWGGWFAFHASANPLVACAASCHPSLDVCKLVGEDPKTAVCDRIQCPQLVLAAGNDKPNVKKGGLLEKSLASKPAVARASSFHTFPSMIHGWVNRGDLEHAPTAAAIKDVFRLVRRFFTTHLLRRRVDNDGEGSAVVKDHEERPASSTRF